uniref:Uncharacterized protein n=1 Tax=Leersia perrieri TaxID=77586 RepID=A0A0D9XHX9_9ORYZ
MEVPDYLPTLLELDFDLECSYGRWCAALTHRDVKNHGMGYDWRGIQRVDFEDQTWVMIGEARPRATRRGLRGRCKRCDRLISFKNSFCSPCCKVLMVVTGRGRHIVQRLVTADFSRSHLRDRFCTHCLSFFGSAQCIDHTLPTTQTMSYPICRFYISSGTTAGCSYLKSSYLHI